MSAFGMSVRLDVPLAEALERARTALADQGFDILTEIDVAATLQTKLGVEVAPQVILGACNAPLAREGLRIEPDLGLLLPCNVVVRAVNTETTAVETFDPEFLAGLTGGDAVRAVASDARERLTTMLDNLSKECCRDAT